MSSFVTDPSLLCLGCFHSLDGLSVCVNCGYDERPLRNNSALPPRMILAGQYLVGKILGSPGGFGIAYLGFDLKQNQRVAIKEFLPRECSTRGTDHCSVIPVDRDKREDLNFGLSRFLEEAKILFQLSHPNIVHVRQFFEENNTAYIVMDYYEGMSLDEHIIKLGRALTEAETLKIILPLLDGLKHVHAKGLIHRDIKPANIYLTRDGRPVLLDFGAARFSLGERTRSLTMCLTPGYAPFEQYQERSRQGPWTDIYAMACTMYFMFTKQVPPAGTDRIMQDKLISLSSLAPQLNPILSQAITRGMAVKSQDRPQSIEEFMQPINSVARKPIKISAPEPSLQTPDINSTLSISTIKQLWGLSVSILFVSVLIYILLLLSPEDALSPIILAAYCGSAYLLYRICVKFGIGSYLGCCVPVYNGILLCRCAGLSGWASIYLYLLPGYSIYVFGTIARRLGKGFWGYGLGHLLLFPLFIIAFDNSKPINLIVSSKQNNQPISGSLNTSLSCLSMTFLNGELSGETLPVTSTGIVIGRSHGKANIILNESEISKAHVRVALDERTGSVLVEDLNSTNGTFYRALSVAPIADNAGWSQLKGTKTFNPHQAVEIRLCRNAVNFRISS